MDRDALALMSVHAFSHDAMNTTFTLRIRGEDGREAAGVARECFEHLDYLENKLSRYIEGSDVWQINHMSAGESLFLSEPCHDCLRLSAEANRSTGGLFDITLGRQIEHLKNDEPGTPPPLAGQLAIDPEHPVVQCVQAGREIDLGGIGKGYALDQMKVKLADWGVESALLSAGASTQLAHGEHAWPIELTGDASALLIELRNMALSASGTGIQGSHIVSPDPGIEGCALKRIWITNTSAAMADAWSTALMLIPVDQLSDIDLAGASLYIQTETGEVLPLMPE